MPDLAARFRVQDHAHWQQIFRRSASQRRKVGIQREEILHRTQDCRELLVVLEVTDLERARQYFLSPESQQRQQESGSQDIVVYAPAG
jgi:hypothetical protein